MILISDAVYLQGFPILLLSALHLFVTSYLKKMGENCKIQKFHPLILSCLLRFHYYDGEKGVCII